MSANSFADSMEPTRLTWLLNAGIDPADAKAVREYERAIQAAARIALGVAAPEETAVVSSEGGEQ